MRLTLFLDHACNLACTYCYNGRKFSRPMSLDTARAAVKLVLDSPTPLIQVGFFGGEPLLQQDLIGQVVEMVRGEVAGRQAEPLFTMTTNATLLDGPTVQRLAAFKMHYGVSIDGPQPYHDAARPYAGGQSSFPKVLAALGHLVQAGAPLKTITVVTPRNLEALADTFRMLADLGVRHVHFSLDYESPWTEADLERYRLALRQLGDAWADRCRAGGPYVLVSIFENKIRSHIKGGYSCADQCDFGCAEWAVAPSGHIYPCDRLVGEDTREDLIIGDVHHGGIFLDRLKALVARKNALPEGCEECQYRQRCMHWCGCVNYAMTGDVGEVDGLLCRFEQIHIEESDRVAALLFQEQNPVFLTHFYKGLVKK
jgi:uncharacterized protein